MKVFPRSSWTSQIPTPFVEWHPNLAYFLETPEVEFCLPNENLLYLYTDAKESLQRLLNAINNASDLDYNYALPANEEGCYAVRGGLNRCQQPNMRVLLLLGNNEEPSDTLKLNQQDFLYSGLELEKPTQLF